VKYTFFSIYILIITYPFPLHSAQHVPLPHTYLTSTSPHSVLQLLSLFFLSYISSWLKTSFRGHGGHFSDNSGRFNSHFLGKEGNYFINKEVKVTNEGSWYGSCIIFWELLEILSNICPVPDIKHALFRGSIKRLTTIFQGHWVAALR
jgi:hypothetical protein